ncbi:MAG: TIGR03905 family TSCPD domain-containing protein [Coprobacillaceae bacterium]
MEIHYQPKGVCSIELLIRVNDDIVEEVKFVGGCHGNAQGIGALAKGMKIKEVIQRLEGIRCGRRNTSCPNQLSVALKEIIYKESI